MPFKTDLPPLVLYPFSRQDPVATVKILDAAVTA
jgi:hypothetical protein